MKTSFAQIRCLQYVMAGALALFAAPAAFAQVASPELQTAQQAVQRAIQADADQYAPDLIATARQGLEQAQQAALDRRQRKTAPQLALRVAADADLARVRSEEAVANAQLKQRKAEVAELERSLNTGEGRP
ncbi:DUF4398 domain-containing protein [Xanthomonas translucens]|uniref:DUF4398 domain-containing protein n=1 Tax=Xanthomonas campestris pv. translucens TaxID=343 RepID=UPI001F47275D|nr:DUF4398 domain-containing protein [Xanthomonas translucens]UKE50386.1 DUF4398 domain-containing protein [Xanthomonas translucens]